MSETWLGVLCWVLLFYPWWSPRCRRIRAAHRDGAVGPSRGRAKVGKAWEQDFPWPECFEEEDL